MPIASAVDFQQLGSLGSRNALHKYVTKPPNTAAPAIAPISAPFFTESRDDCTRAGGCSASAFATAASEMISLGGRGSSCAKAGTLDSSDTSKTVAMYLMRWAGAIAVPRLI